MSKSLYFIALIVVMGGCMVLETRHASREEGQPSKPTPAEEAALFKVADDRTSGSRVQPQFTQRDPKTGTTYLINPQWRILQRGPHTLAKTNGLMQTWTDWSGQVETRIYECVTPAQAQHQNSIGCQVEPGFTLVGGGAYANYGTGGGALLWESRALDANLVTWVASSKDHRSPNAHYLHVYAIGLRLRDNSGNIIPKSNLLGTFFNLHSETSLNPSHAPAESLTATKRNGNPMLAYHYFGGGARTNWSCCGSLLTKNRVSPWRSGSIWVGIGKDHGSSDPSTITVSGIFCPASVSDETKSGYIPNFGTLDFKMTTSNGNNVSTGVAVALLDGDPDYVITGPGGESKWTSGSGRLLFGIKPTGTLSGQITVYSKDHKGVSGGYNIASIMQVRKSR